MDKKITKRTMFENIKAALANATTGDYPKEIEFLDKQIALIDSRNEREKERRAEKQAEGDEFGKAVVAVINEVPKTVDVILGELIERFPEATRSQVVYRANQAVKNGAAYKVKVKIDKGRFVAYTTIEPVEE